MYFDKHMQPKLFTDEAMRSYDHNIFAAKTAEMRDKLELDHFVRTVPTLREKLEQLSHEVSIEHKDGSVPTTSEYEAGRQTAAWFEAAQKQYDRLATVSVYDEYDEEDVALPTKETLEQDINYISHAEYEEACVGLAEYIKQNLSTPSQRIVLVGSLISKLHISDGQQKSDQFLLDSILKHFSNEEIERYGGQLLIDNNSLQPNDKVMIIDDWTLTGEQVFYAADHLIKNNSVMPGRVEMLAVVANRDRIAYGLHQTIENDQPSIPVRAYFLAQSDQETSSLMSAMTNHEHITGWHSSTDAGLEDIIKIIQVYAQTVLEQQVHELDATTQKELELLTTMPYLADIQRQYRTASLENITRFQDIVINSSEKYQ